MGMYTELVLAIELKPEPPPEVLRILQMLVGSRARDGFGRFAQERLFPNHPFFSCGHWRLVLQGSSAYFPGQESRNLLYEPEWQLWTLTSRSSLKNYDKEIEKFWNWLSPFVETEGFCGYYRYEEDREPTLLYHMACKTYRREGQ